MSTGSQFQPRGPMAEFARNPFSIAVAVALACSLALVGFVLIGGAPGEPRLPVEGAPPVSAPDLASSPGEPVIEAASPPPPTATPTATPIPPSPSPTPPPTATSSPSPSPTATATPTPTPLPTPPPVFELSGAELAAMINGSWALTGELLGKSSAATPGEWWITAPALSPPGPFAIEAEIAVDPPPTAPCNASYGVVVNAQYLVWGAGIAYPCDRDSEPTARISDISNPGDGYATDRIVRQKRAKIDPAGWHTIRLEVRGNDMRLYIDGQVWVKAEDDVIPDVDASPPLSIGLWSDGIETQVRRFAVYSLES
jgi:hypothetical protein